MRNKAKEIRRKPPFGRHYSRISIGKEPIERALAGSSNLPPCCGSGLLPNSGAVNGYHESPKSYSGTPGFQFDQCKANLDFLSFIAWIRQNQDESFNFRLLRCSTNPTPCILTVQIIQKLREPNGASLHPNYTYPAGTKRIFRQEIRYTI